MKNPTHSAVQLSPPHPKLGDANFFHASEPFCCSMDASAAMQGRSPNTSLILPVKTQCCGSGSKPL